MFDWTQCYKCRNNIKKYYCQTVRNVSFLHNIWFSTVSRINISFSLSKSVQPFSFYGHWRGNVTVSMQWVDPRQCDGRISSATSPSTHDTDAPRRGVPWLRAHRSGVDFATFTVRRTYTVSRVTVNPRYRRTTARRESAHIGQVSTSPPSQYDGRIPSAASPSSDDTDAPRHSSSLCLRLRLRSLPTAVVALITVTRPVSPFGASGNKINGTPINNGTHLKDTTLGNHRVSPLQ